jgi:hypothetical protein
MAGRGPDLADLREWATRLRRDVVQMVAHAGSGHNGVLNHDKVN